MSDEAFEREWKETWNVDTPITTKKMVAEHFWQAALAEKLHCGHPLACRIPMQPKEGDTELEYYCMWCADRAKLEAERNALRAFIDHEYKMHKIVCGCAANPCVRRKELESVLKEDK